MTYVDHTMMVIEVVCDDCVNFLEDIPILSPIPRELQANILLNIKTIKKLLMGLRALNGTSI